MTPRAEAVWRALADKSNHEGISFATVATIGAWASFSASTADQALRELIRGGYVERIPAVGMNRRRRALRLLKIPR